MKDLLLKLTIASILFHIPILNASAQCDTFTIDSISTYTYHFIPNDTIDSAEYIWKFGDSSPYSYAYSPTHTYADTGCFTITLITSLPGGSVCIDTTKSICISDSTLSLNNYLSIPNDIHIYPNPSSTFWNIVFNSSQSQPLKISVRDIIGREIFQTDYRSKIGFNKLNIPISSFASGIYNISIRNEKGNISVKAVKI